jgi:hypothetical protein
VFPLFANGVVNTSGKIYAGIVPPISMTPVVRVAKFAANVVDTNGKFATGVVDTGGAP